MCKGPSEQTVSLTSGFPPEGNPATSTMTFKVAQGNSLGDTALQTFQGHRVVWDISGLWRRTKTWFFMSVSQEGGPVCTWRPRLYVADPSWQLQEGAIASSVGPVSPRGRGGRGLCAGDDYQPKTLGSTSRPELPASSHVTVCGFVMGVRTWKTNKCGEG